jgi:hypothetical protein
MIDKVRLTTQYGRPVLGGALTALAVLGMAAPAAIAEVKSGNDKISLAISGQINRAVLWADDGDEDEIFHVDNDNSSTRVRFIGKGQFSENFSVGTQMEVQFESNSTADIRMDQTSPGGDNNFTERKLEFYLDHKQLGRLWLGQGDTASNGSSEIDLSGTTVINYSGIADMMGGIEFGGAGVGPRINQAWSNFDGFSRQDRIRYDTPKLAGFQAKVSAFEAENDGWDVALSYSNDYGFLKVAAAVAYGETDVKDQLNGSISLLHESGISATFATGERDLKDVGDREDPFFWYAKLGYRFHGFDFGSTRLAVDYGQADDVAADDDEFETFGVFVVQMVDAIATEFYAGYRNHSLDQLGDNPDDINGVIAGARIKF